MPYFECDNDKLLIQALSIDFIKKDHKGDKGRVCNALKNGMHLTGMVDEDPMSNKPSYYKNLNLIESSYNINIFSDKNRNNILIELKPDLEGWLINLFKNKKIDFIKYNIPATSSEFKFLSKSQNKSIKIIIQEQLESCLELQTLKKYLRH